MTEELLPHTSQTSPRQVLITHPVNEVGATHSSDSANVVHEAHVALGGAVHLAHLDVSKAIEEPPPDVRPQPVPDSHPHLVNFIYVSLTGGGG